MLFDQFSEALSAVFDGFLQPLGPTVHNRVDTAVPFVMFGAYQKHKVSQWVFNVFHVPPFLMPRRTSRGGFALPLCGCGQTRDLTVKTLILQCF